MMTRKHWYRWTFLACFAAGGFVPAQEPSRPAVQSALETIFSPQRAPEEKTMGLLQRSFLDLAEQSQPALQIAFVVDGTTSMGDSLAGVRDSLMQMTNDLELYKAGKISFQLVVFRDAGAPSGPVTLPLGVSDNAFTSDRVLLQSALRELTAESGAPYFPEQVDRGLHVALRDLKWSTDTTTSRWIFLFTDAPPFDPNFEEKENQARRHVDTQLLIDQAKQRGIKINCIVCTSREADRAAFERGLDRTRAFMNQMATGTDGVMLDLSYADIRSSLDVAANQPVRPQVRIGVITRQDLEQGRQAAGEGASAMDAERRLRLAILPHRALAGDADRPTDKAVQIATELRETWRRAGAEVSNPRLVYRALSSLQRQGLEDSALRQALAAILKVDYVVWGHYTTRRGVTKLESAFYARSDGQVAVSASGVAQAAEDETEICGKIAQALVSEVVSRRANLESRLVNTLARVQSQPTLMSEVITPVSTNLQVRSDVLAGLEELENALAYPAGSDEGLPHLEAAREYLTKATGTDGDEQNAWAQLLLANCHYNLRAYHVKQQQADQVRSDTIAFVRSLARAYQHRKNVPVRAIQEEIVADYLLLRRQNHADALKRYEQLARNDEQANPNVALRAHWMLAGLYLGDWGTPKSLVDAEAARKHIVEIMTHWPDSSQAKFVRKQLRWDERQGQTRFEHFLLLNDDIPPGSPSQ